MQNPSAVYLLYCIVENKDEVTSGRFSGKSSHVSSPIPPLAVDFEKISYKDITVVARKIDAKITELLKDNTVTYIYDEQLKNWLLEYQQTNINIFRRCNILPLRFGTIVERKEEIETFLASSYIHEKWALDKLRGKAEFAVQISWDLNRVLQEIVQDNNWLEKAGKSIDLEDKVEMGRLLFERAEAIKRDIIYSIHHELIKVSYDSSEGRGTNDSIIMNRSYLIEKTAERAFDKAMMELGKENKSYLSLKYVGPIPPYSFAPIEFRQGNFELIDKARKTLMLPERAWLEEIKASYRNLSMKYHPDKNFGDQQCSELFKQIDEAYKIIEAYCSSCEGFSAFRRNKKYSFARNDVEKMFVISRRAEMPAMLH